MRFLRHTMFCLVPATLAALVLGVPPAAAQLTLQSVGLSCSDGTALNLAVSPTEVIDLSGAVLAVNSLCAVRRLTAEILLATRSAVSRHQETEGWPCIQYSGRYELS